MTSQINIKNKKARYEYELIEKFVAGIQLTGTEIKSIRAGKASLTDSFCHFSNNELWTKGIHISEYKFGSHSNHDPKRNRKLLLNRKELYKLEKKTTEKGLTIIVTRLFINDNRLAKVEIALARGKKMHDKREDIKQKDLKREIGRRLRK